jgi:hypothetical protein
MGLLGRFSLHPHDRKASIRVPVRAVEQAATVRQRKSVPSPLVVADLTEHIGEELSVPHSSAKSTAQCQFFAFS